MLQSIARSEFYHDKQAVDPKEVIADTEAKALPAARRSAPTMDNFVFVSPDFLKKHSKIVVNRRMYYVANENKQLAFITDNAGATVTPLAHASPHQLKDGMKHAKLPFKHRIMMFERGHLSLPPESSPLWQELFRVQYIARHSGEQQE